MKTIGRTIGALLINEIFIHIITWATILFLVWVGGNFWRSFFILPAILLSTRFTEIGEWISKISPGDKTRIACLILALIESISIIWNVYHEDTYVGKRLVTSMLIAGLLGYRPIAFYIVGLLKESK